jgi:hypothetical protein
VERRFTKDQLLTTVILYWVTETIGSSFRFHRDWALGAASLPEALADGAEVPAGAVRPLGRDERIQVPAALALFDYPVPGSGPSGPMGTCAASPICLAAATSRPWRSPSCWPRTCAGSSGACGSGPPPGGMAAAGRAGSGAGH